MLFSRLIHLLDINKRYALITDENVASLYTKAIRDELGSFQIEIITFPEGEMHKTRATKEKIEDEMFLKGIDRECTMIALGGGVVTDLAGFVAATYARGIPLINVPTTLMGMVDAAIGGKTGVNVVNGKNWIGAFYPAQHVVIEEQFLKTLPPKEIRNGFAEVVKYGAIDSPSLLNSLDCMNKRSVITECMAIKQRIVQEDLKESGKRRILNFGHTFAHALESLLDYQIRHGEAVAAGLIFESYVSHLMGGLAIEEVEQMIALLRDFSFPNVEMHALLHAMRRDKKGAAESIRCVVLSQFGKPIEYGGDYCTVIPNEVLADAYDYLLNSK